MNKPNNKRKKSSQDKIEKVFLQLVQKYEIEEISVTDICKLASVNRSTFYSNYLDIYDLVEKVRNRMIKEYANLYQNDEKAGHNPESYLKMFYHIKENPIFYKTYFKLKFDLINDDIFIYDKELAQKFYQDQFIDYHCLFFKAGLTAIIKKWLNNGCKESPEEIFGIIASEYSGKEKID